MTVINGDDRFVLLKHEQAGQPQCVKPYHYELAVRYQSRPPMNKKFKVLGIYPSRRAAVEAMKLDAE